MDVQTPVEAAVAAPPPTPLDLLVDACRTVLDGSDTPPAAAAVSFIRGMIGT